MRGLTRGEVRAIDRQAIEVFGLPGIVLMENAGRNAAERIEARAPHGRVVIVCGKGNNAGDGYVIARHLELAGREVAVLSAVEPEALVGDAALNHGVASRAGIPIVSLATADGAAWRRALTGVGVIVDALLGTGAIGAPRGAIATAIEAINAMRAADDRVVVCAIDLPSGLDGDDGSAPGVCVRADHTVTLVAPKVGFAAPSAAALLGTVEVVGIGAPACLLAAAGVRDPSPSADSDAAGRGG